MLKSALKKSSLNVENIDPTPIQKKRVHVTSDCEIRLMSPQVEQLVPRKVPIVQSLPVKIDVQHDSKPRKVLTPIVDQKSLLLPRKVPLTEERLKRMTQSSEKPVSLPRKVPLTAERLKRMTQLSDNYYIRKKPEFKPFSVQRLPRNHYSANKNLYPKTEFIYRKNFSIIPKKDKVKMMINFSEEDAAMDTIPTYAKRHATFNKREDSVTRDTMSLDENNLISKPIHLEFTPSHNSTFIHDLKVEKLRSKLNFDDDDDDDDIKVDSFNDSTINPPRFCPSLTSLDKDGNDENDYNCTFSSLLCHDGLNSELIKSGIKDNATFWNKLSDVEEDDCDKVERSPDFFNYKKDFEDQVIIGSLEEDLSTLPQLTLLDKIDSDVMKLLERSTSNILNHKDSSDDNVLIDNIKDNTSSCLQLDKLYINEKSRHSCGCSDILLNHKNESNEDSHTRDALNLDGSSKHYNGCDCELKNVENHGLYNTLGSTQVKCASLKVDYEEFKNIVNYNVKSVYQTPSSSQVKCSFSKVDDKDADNFERHNVIGLYKISGSTREKCASSKVDNDELKHVENHPVKILYNTLGTSQVKCAFLKVDEDELKNVVSNDVKGLYNTPSSSQVECSSSIVYDKVTKVHGCLRAKVDNDNYQVLKDLQVKNLHETHGSLQVKCASSNVDNKDTKVLESHRLMSLYETQVKCSSSTVDKEDDQIKDLYETSHLLQEKCSSSKVDVLEDDQIKGLYETPHPLQGKCSSSKVDVLEDDQINGLYETLHPLQGKCSSSKVDVFKSHHVKSLYETPASSQVKCSSSKVDDDVEKVRKRLDVMQQACNHLEGSIKKMQSIQ